MTMPLTAGRYQLHTRLGQGASGVVYEATDPDRDRHVVVKVMLPDVAQDATSRQHFLREARAVSRLRHRHLVVVYDVAGNDEPPFVAMERLRGRTLAERLTIAPAPTLAESLEIVEQVCLGLQYAHEHGLVHRNLTPANIWLLEDGSVKVTDFGLPTASAPTVTDSRMLVGRVAYLSPEQIAAKPVDGRADIFAAGVVLFELVTGRRPFEADSITGIFDKVVNEAAPPVSGEIPAEAELLEEVLRRALAKDPSSRYAEALEMAADLTLTRIALIGEPSVSGVLDEPSAAEVGSAPARVPVPPVPVPVPAPVPEPEPEPLRLRSRVEPQPAEDETWESTPLPQGLGAAHVPSYAASRGASPGLFERVRAAIASAAQENPMALAVFAAAGVLAIVIGAWLALRTPAPPPATRQATASPATSRTATPEVPQVRIESEPADAEVFVNGAALGSRTPVALPADRLRNAEVRLVKPGYDPLVVRVTPEQLAQRALSLQLVAEAAPITVSGSAPFEFEVVSGRTVVSRSATSHRFTIRGGQTLRVRAPEYYLDRAVTIPADKPAVTLYVPPLGRLSVRVSPALERCRVSVGGRDFGTPPFPPVPFQEIVAGAHRVELTCPDGAVRQQSITVEAARDRAAIFR